MFIELGLYSLPERHGFFATENTPGGFGGGTATWPRFTGTDLHDSAAT